MNILFLSSWFPCPPDNGSKLRVYHLLRALAQEHKVTLASFTFGSARPDEPDGLAGLLSGLYVVQVDPFLANRTGLLRTFLSTAPVASRPIPAMSQPVADLLQAAHFDAVIASTEIMAHYALSAPSASARILEEHNSPVRWLWERFRREEAPVQRMRCWLSWQKHRRYEARLLRQFDLVTMVSEADRAATKETIGAAKTAVEVVPNGVDCRHNYPGIAKVRPHDLIYSGALTYSANYDAVRFFLAEVLPLIRREIVDVRLTITGATDGVPLHSLPLDECVYLSGYVDDIRPYVSSAAVCVVPLREGGGTRLKILEAMALGTPVVSTTKGAEGLEVVHGEHLLIADEPERFAAYTVELLRRPELRQRLAENARRLVEQKYDWAGIGRRFVSLVEDVVRERAGTALSWRGAQGGYDMAAQAHARPERAGL